MRRAAIVALTVGTVLVLTAAMVALGAPAEYRHAQLLVYLLVCAAAPAIGGRVAWVAAMASCGAALILTGFGPVGLPHAQDPGLLAETVVFVGVTAAMASLVEGGTRARLRAQAAEHATTAALAAAAHAEEQARALTEIRRSDDQLRRALETLIDPIEILEAVRDEHHAIVDYRLRYVNHALAASLSRTPDELIGGRVKELFPAMEPALLTLWNHVVETGEPVTGDDVALRSVIYPGRRRFDLRGGRFEDGLVFTYRDVTEQAEASERLRQSERLYRLLADNTSDVVYVVAGDVIRWASPSSLKQIGWTPEELAGRRWDSILAPEYRDAAASVQQLARPGERQVVRARYVAQDGSEHWTDLVLGVLVDDDGNPEATLVSARRVDAEVEAEELLAEAQRQRERLIEQLPVGVFRARTSPNGGLGTLEYVSARAGELFRCPPDVRDIAALLHQIEPADIPRVITASEQAARTRSPLSCDVRLAGVQPTAWMRIVANIERLADGDLLIDGLVSDVTKEKAYEDHVAREAEDAARRIDEFAAIDRTRSALLAALGHDLRTPLAVVASSASGLRHTSGLTAAQRDELLGNIEQSADLLAHLLTNLLDLSRVEAGSLPVRLEPVPVVEALEEPLRRAGAGVLLDLPDDLPDVIADRGLLERVLDNLLRNADRHRPPGTAVEVVARMQGGDRVVVRVIDHGSGIPAERFDQIFVPFQRLNDRETGGLGLGLSIARAFTQAMGGRITPSETPGGGLTMSVDLAAG